MSNLLEEYRKRSDLIRDLKNKYKLGLHPLLKNADGVQVHYPKGHELESENKDITSEETKTYQSHSPRSDKKEGFLKRSGQDSSENAKSEIAKSDNMFGEFEYQDVFEDLYCKPFMDDEDWISSDEEDTTEESKKNASYGSSHHNSGFGTESERTKTNDENNAGNDSDSQEELREVAPEKVNWLKYIFKKHTLKGQEDYEILNSSAVIESVLEVLLSDSVDDMIQGKLLDLIGYERFDMLIELIEKRKFIQSYCRALSYEISKEKKGQKVGPNPTSVGIGVSVIFGDRKKNRNKKGNKGQNTAVSNHDLLSKLGFEDDYIKESRMLGLKQSNYGDFALKNYENPYGAKTRKAQEYRATGNTGKMKYAQQSFDEPDWKEVHLIPPERNVTAKNDLISVSSMMEWMQPAFKTCENLNTIQSIVFDMAFNTINNILVAAPTGAGKTNIALLTILREVRQYASEGAKTLDMTDKPMKIVYLAPLKALASEIVDKFTKALSYLKIKVRELTGDMNLTKTEIKETHVIVSTPEKWDVVTRKADGLMNEVNLMIIDEIHLLNDERGTVLE
jgi:hypothetical protein